MTEKEKRYFSELTQMRSNGADILSQSFLSGIWEGIIEKYSDQAHFIYELLQNADDVCATYAKFVLYRDRLVFKHNGTRHFHVSDPKNEKQDKENGTLGDLNSISSAAQSSKKGKDAIGKFGVGFKAVFQYTETPHIYDPNVAFKIERFIVPLLLDSDYQNRKKDETVFVFPFDHKERDACEAFEDIFDKLRNLVYPILFLKHLKDVSFDVDTDHTFGMYEKNRVQEKSFGDISAQKIELVYTEGNDIATDLMWLFSRKDNFGRDYCVGFFMNADEKLQPVNMPAFCYFPTKEDTKLNFIIHAPFLLTDSREGIKAGEEYNKNLVSLLAKLSADALYCLREIETECHTRIIGDEILDIIPFDNSVFANINDKSKISFLPFYNSIQTALKNGLLPTIDSHVDYNHAYWSNTLDINALISDEQLAQLLNAKDAHWVFCTKPRRALDSYGILRNYIDNIVCEWLDENDIFNNIDVSFIKRQPLEWLHKFYKWISDAPRRFTNGLKDTPIFLDANGEPVAAYDENGQKTLFLPSAAVKDCPTIHPELLKDANTKSFLLDVVKLEEPSLQDYIYNTVIPNYHNDNHKDPFAYFKLFFSYYKECRATEIDNYIDEIKELNFLEYFDEKDRKYHCSNAEKLYYPDEKLIEYFFAKPDTHFIALQRYTDEYPHDTDLNSFLNELGILHSPRVYSYELSYSDIRTYSDLPHEKSTAGHQYTETRIDGCIELAEYIVKNMVAEKSYILWDSLVKIFDSNEYINPKGKYCYRYYSPRTIYYNSIMAQTLQNQTWLVDKDGNFVCVGDIKLSDLSSAYDTTSEAAQKLIEYLGFEEEETNEPLTEEEKLANMCKKYGIESEADFIEFKEWKRQKELRDNPPEISDERPPSGSQSAMDSIAKDISKIAKKNRQKKEEGIENPLGEMPSIWTEHEEIDRDEFTPGTVDYQSKIDIEKERQAEELHELAQMQELQDIALSTEKYSYLWFKTLLDMEILNSDANTMDSREVNISFGKIEKEDGTIKTYVLKHPSKYIPQYMEDLTDIPLVVRMKDGSSKTVAIEVSSVQSYSLHVKLKDADGLSDTDLSNVQENSIKATRPVFLLQALKEKLIRLKDEDGKLFADEFNLKENLPKNIEFVFGPPGTGKTTYLANKVLMPLMQQREDVKVLVLTPTNKAADVITARIMETMGGDTSYTNWLTRFGITGDEKIEGSEIFRDKTFDLRSLPRSVTITTIARFAYDFFMPKTERLYLDALNWDYIVIDEASMIPIVQIIYPLFRKTPRKFIIAGDPFQIEPITTVELWADENIYKLVELNSFTNPQTVPHDYSIVKLTTQYRSTPEIGNVFSKFTYGGILDHHRTSDSRRDLHLDGIMDFDSLNVLKFPVSKYESIYRPKRLNGTTPYQAYSAIFTMEFVNFLSKALSKRNPGKKFNIGIVAPYKAQASLIDRLMSSVSVPSDVKVQVGTIHGFQGDECDIVMVVLNTPPGISASPKLFLNKQNVLNVAISRSKDYLFLIMPDNQTENIFKLQKIKRIEDLMRHSGHFTEQTTSAIEKTIFDDGKYIENNSFATSHQTVNVYGQPEKRYEIRSEDNAVDIQVHRGKKIVKDTATPETKSRVKAESTLTPATVPVPLTQPHKNETIIKVGDMVKHKVYGEGKICSIVGTGSSCRINVIFSIGEKAFTPMAISQGLLTKV